ncbi:Uncharacterised protein [Vibrio cholerae]|nr:Uncharacterised protein [Vibrio cholerae]CSI83159.1 Uncharacterised protein [Vibrio cholerae]
MADGAYRSNSAHQTVTHSLAITRGDPRAHHR